MAAGIGEPLPRAQVTVRGTGLGALTDEEGRYRVEGVPAGRRTVRVRLIGYRTATRTLRVPADGTAAADFALRLSPLSLEEVVVTATGPRRLRELGNAVATIDAAEMVERRPVANVSELLSGSAPGLQVGFSTGTTGAGNSILLRGASHVRVFPMGVNQPLVYVDGARVNTSPNSMSNWVGGQGPSRINDVNPEEIESVEIVRGPSAATLYGTEAANGVIRIETRRGSGGDDAPRWQFWAEGGRVTNAISFPANYRAVDAEGRPCPLPFAARGICRQAELRSFNLLENPGTTPLRDGDRQSVGGSVATSVGHLDLFTSGDWERETGVYPNNRLERVSLRANAGGRVGREADLRVSTGYVSSDLSLPHNDEDVFGFLGNALLGGAGEDEWFLHSPEELRTATTRQDVERFTASAELTWRPRGWLALRATGGADVTNRNDDQLFPPGGIDRPSVVRGFRDADRHQTLDYTAEAHLRAELEPLPGLAWRTTVGGQYFVDQRRSVFTEGEQLTPGTSSLASAAVTRSDESRHEVRTLGLFLEEQVGYRNRLFLTAGARADDNSSFGRDFDVIVYPKVSLSWIALEEPWFPSPGALGSLRLRAAWGQSGNQPGPGNATRFFEGASVTDPEGADRIGVTFEGGGIGNPELRPERSGEVEAGLDAVLVGGRVHLSATYFRQETSDALVFRPVAPSLGGPGGRWENLGTTRNRGVEGQLDARLVDSRDLRVDLTLGGSVYDTELVELGEGVDPVRFVRLRQVEGFSLGGYWAPPVTGFADADGNGMISPDEVTVGDTAVFLDESNPPVEGSIRPTAVFFDRLRVSGLFELRAGHSRENATEAFRCLFGNSRLLHDPATPAADQAACVSRLFLGTMAGFISDADWMKLREVSVTLTAPRRWTRALGTDGLTLTVAGRNLATWTAYPGLDPEATWLGGFGFPVGEFLTQPPVRRWTARVNLRL